MKESGADSRWKAKSDAESQTESSTEIPKPRASRPRWVLPLRSIVVVVALALSVVTALLVNTVVERGEPADQQPASVTVPPLVSATPSVFSPPGGLNDDSKDAVAAKTTVSSAAEKEQLFVHVAGAVKRPGIVKVSKGARTFQAIAAAGGATANADLGAVNLAAPVTDGTRIFLPVHGQQATGTSESLEGIGASVGTGEGSAQTVGAKVNINTATATELDSLPGVGPVMAERIVAWRQSHGGFSSIDALDAIQGIGPKLLASLRELVTL